MVIFFTTGGVLLGIAIVVLLILSGIGLAEMTIQNIIQNYGVWIALVLAVIAMVVWAIATSSSDTTPKSSNKLNAKSKLNRWMVVIFSAISSSLAVFNCLLVIYLVFKIFVDGLDKDGLLIIFTAVIYIFKGIFWLLAGLVIGAAGIGLPAIVVFDEKEPAKNGFAGVSVIVTFVGVVIQIAAFCFLYYKIS